ncbi:MAG: hypothetical protein WAZ14_03825 [Patescibacteria group bacterium]
MAQDITPEQRDLIVNRITTSAREAIDSLKLNADQARLVIDNPDGLARIVGDVIRNLIALFVGVEERVNNEACLMLSADEVAKLSAWYPDYIPEGIKSAREILGNDFISPGEIEASRPGLVYSLLQWQELSNSVPSKEVLEWCRDNGFMLVAGPPRPMSLLEIHELDRGHLHSKEANWYAAESEAFASYDKAACRWLMLRKEPVPDSIEKTWDEQQQLLSSLEVTPNVAEQVWGLAIYKAVRGVGLLRFVYVRTSSTDSDGNRVSVGCFDRDGTILVPHYNHCRYDRIGISSSRK